MHKKFEIDQTRKVVTHNSKSDLPLVSWLHWPDWQPVFVNKINLTDKKVSFPWKNTLIICAECCEVSESAIAD